MKITPYILFFAINLAFFACKQEAKAPVNAPAVAPVAVVEQPLTFNNQVIEKVDGDTTIKKDVAPQFARLSFAFPKAVGGKKGVSDSINLWLVARLKEPINMSDGDVSKISLDSTIKQYFAEHQKSVKEFSGASNAWENEIKGNVTLQNSKIVCLETTSYSYNGGAHPNSFVAYQIFDVATGKKVEAQKGITNMSAFLALAEKKFRAERKIPAKKSFEKAYFNFPEKNKFSLPANIGVNEKGLTLFYNDYEIASHATGSTQIFIPFEELTGIFDKNLLM
jgi:Deacetylase PdaC/Protein of unknown function (DUF3298)